MRVVVCLCVAGLAGACGARRGQSLDIARVLRESDAALKSAAQKAEQAGPPAKAPQVTIEQHDPKLAIALVAVAARPTADNHRAAAAEYTRLRVFDKADEHLSRAIAADRHNGALFDARARVRRDMGAAGLALPDAWRAWYYRPAAATANTLGTVFEAAGNLPEARRWYGRALEAQPKAWFALNNVCHAETMLGLTTAKDACQRSLAAAPSSRVARHNLALAQAAAGEFAQARQSFSSSDTPATAAYNMGIVFMATRQFDRAVAELTTASAAAPTSTQIRARLAQASSAQHLQP